MFQFLKNIFKIPNTPYALPLENFLTEEEEQNRSTVYTWEDWERDAKALYPIRYFLSKTLPFWFKVQIIFPLDHYWWWLKYHTTHRYHIVDLRQHDYKYGWLEFDQRILFACFNLLTKFMQNSDIYRPSDSDIKDCPNLKRQQEVYDEAIKLWRYWRDQYPNDQDDLEKEWKNMIKCQDKELRKELSRQFYSKEDELKCKEDEMLNRLIAIRRELWD